MREVENARKGHMAVFLATSGHSGVDRVMKTLLPSIAIRGFRVDLLHVKRHGPFMEEISPGLRVIELGASHSVSSLFPLVRYLKKEKPNVLLSDKDRVNQIALAAAWLAGGKTRNFLRFGQTVTKFLESQGPWQKTTHSLSMRYLYRAADGIITPSRGSARDLASFAGIPEQRITVIPNPVDVREIRNMASEQPDHPWFRVSEVPVVVGLGELTSRKGFDTLIRAFATFRGKKPARLFLMGKGSGRDSLEKLCADLGIREDVEFAGFRENPFPFLAHADLFVQPSRYEGFGMALLEALALGVPVVATDCPSGPREILQDGKYGCLVPVEDFNSMAAAMEKTLDFPPDAGYIAEAVTPYTLEKVTDRYIEVLKP